MPPLLFRENLIVSFIISTLIGFLVSIFPVSKQSRIYSFVLYFSEIDSGWIVARINDNAEFIFLGTIFKTFTNQERLYIGGNTDTAPDQFLDEGFGSDSGRVLGKVNFTVRDL